MVVLRKVLQRGFGQSFQGVKLCIINMKFTVRGLLNKEVAAVKDQGHDGNDTQHNFAHMGRYVHVPPIDQQHNAKGQGQEGKVREHGPEMHSLVKVNQCSIVKDNHRQEEYIFSPQVVNLVQTQGCEICCEYGVNVSPAVCYGRETTEDKSRHREHAKGCQQAEHDPKLLGILPGKEENSSK